MIIALWIYITIQVALNVCIKIPLVLPYFYFIIPFHSTNYCYCFCYLVSQIYIKCICFRNIFYTNIPCVGEILMKRSYWLILSMYLRKLAVMFISNESKLIAFKMITSLIALYAWD